MLQLLLVQVQVQVGQIMFGLEELQRQELESILCAVLSGMGRLRVRLVCFAGTHCRLRSGITSAPTEPGFGGEFDWRICPTGISVSQRGAPPLIL